MAEQNTDTQPQNPTETDSTTANGKNGQAQFDLKNLTDDQLAQVYDNPKLYEHPRFKDLISAKNQLKKFQEEQALAEEKRLEEQKEYQKLADRYKKDANQLKKQLDDTKLDFHISEKARSLGAVDPSVVLKLVDRGKITINEDGTVIGVEEAVSNLLKEKAYLKGNGTTPEIGTATNPGGDTSGMKRFKASQLSDPAFFQANEADIMKALKLNLIENDLPDA